MIERLESDAVLRYGIEDVVTNLDVLERMQPSESLLRAVLHTKHLMNPEVLAAARRIVCQVVEEIMARLAKKFVRLFLVSAIAVAVHLFHWRETLISKVLCAPTATLAPATRQVVYRIPRFNSRIKRQSEQWQLVLLVDQSGSMVDSVIHSAVMAACCGSYPAFVPIWWRLTQASLISRQTLPIR
ncbi:von Willebrand factor type A domain protein YehP [Escherichia coli]|uniref:von Willebrand factor type A domain protein YehP n=1 Tax=Escherichia coli TaxID=562 RepID=A0A376Y7V1_ECOLX|nr:von Willebrand factor type A domain protein YehP [Escherichia coli]